MPAEVLSVSSASFMSYLVKSLELAPNGVDHTPASLIFSAVQLNAGNKVGAAGMQLKKLDPANCPNCMPARWLPITRTHWAPIWLYHGFVVGAGLVCL